MKKLWKSGDSAGALVRVRATGVPVGLGSPVYAKLDADLAGAMMGINAATGVEIGAGFAAVGQKGTEHRDEMTPEGFESNHAGGRSEEHTSELQSRGHLVCRLLL